MGGEKSCGKVEAYRENGELQGNDAGVVHYRGKRGWTASLAIAHTGWILKKEWLEDCCTQRKKVAEKRYTFGYDAGRDGGGDSDTDESESSVCMCLPI